MPRYRWRMGAQDVVSVVSEVIGWIALGAGLACLLLALLIRIADGRWLRTDAVVIDHEEHSVVRWFAEGAFHSRILGPEERARVTRRDDEPEPAYYKQRDPDRLRLDPPHGRRVVRDVGFVLLGVAMLAGLVGLLLLLFE